MLTLQYYEPYKKSKRSINQILLGKNSVPQGLVELFRYTHNNGPINFKFEKLEDGSIVAKSTNFRWGSIITFAKNESEIDVKIKDAILTSFEIPSSYAKEL